MNTTNVTCQMGAQEIKIETGKLAKLADGAVTIQLGDTIVLVTAVSQTSIKEDQDWFPLSVEYKEKASAAGLFPGGYFKREGRPTEKEILTCRMTDRPLRPLFPKGYFYDTQIVSLLLSADGINDSDILSINGASAALTISDIPFNGPIGAVRVGMIEGNFIVNPTFDERKESQLDLVYVGLKDKVIMIEGGANEVPDDKFKEALSFAQESIQSIILAQEELKEKVGKQKRDVALLEVQEDLLEIAYNIAGERIEDAINKNSKNERSIATLELKKEVQEAILEKYPKADSFDISQAFDYLKKKAFRVSILDKGVRCDGRDVDTIRPLSGEKGMLPCTHGSALFARGETQVLSVATLASESECQYIDNYAGGEDTKRFILHYNFPPFSVGETGRMGGMNRREIGHGSLAERSIEPVIPDPDKFPYAIRVSSEVMESNGSTSMASVCSGSMALFDAGVPLIRPVAGISVGLVTEVQNDNIDKYVTILDIIGNEDFNGDMDFKLCGSSEGITGFQLDLKLPGIPLDILFEGADKALKGRMKVLDVMNSVIDSPNNLNNNAPRIEKIKINSKKIGELIGPGGKNIKAIQAETGSEINIDDNGEVTIYASRKEALDRSIELVNKITAEITVGEIYRNSKVVSTTKFGAFVEVLPGKDAMVHISQLADYRVDKVEDIVNVGDLIDVKCIGIDEKGRARLSLKEAQS